MTTEMVTLRKLCAGEIKESTYVFVIESSETDPTPDPSNLLPRLPLRFSKYGCFLSLPPHQQAKDPR